MRGSQPGVCVDKSRLTHLYFCTSLLLGWFIFFGVTSKVYSQSDTKNILIILDASGSMWGRIDGTPKITLAREVIRDFIKTIPPEVELGLIAYGHRRKKDCGDVELLLPFGVDRNVFITALETIRPKGRTPLALSVERGVETFRELPGSYSIVLVTDGKETCGGDPCEVVRTLKKSGVDFTMHVVGFGVKSKDQEELECIAREGDGQFITALNKDELRVAVGKVTREEPKPRTLKVTSLKNGEVFKSLVHVFSSSSGLLVEYGQTGDDGVALFQLFPGHYRVRVTDQWGSKEEKWDDEVILEEADEERIFRFFDGVLVVCSQRNGEPLQSVVRVYPSGQKEKFVQHQTGQDSCARFVLMLGNYYVEVTDEWGTGLSLWLEHIRVQEGAKNERTLNFHTASLTVDAFRNGDYFQSVVKVMSKGTGKLINSLQTHKTRGATFILLPGVYDVIVEDPWETRSQQKIENVELEGGQKATEKVYFEVGFLEVSAFRNEEALQTVVRVYRTGSKISKISRQTTPENPASFMLVPGVYDIEVEEHWVPGNRVRFSGVEIEAEEKVVRIARFITGTLELTVESEQSEGGFEILIFDVNSGEQVVRKMGEPNESVEFQLDQGVYDIEIKKGEEKDKSIWLRKISVEEEETTSRKIHF